MMSNLSKLKQKIGQRLIIGFDGTEIPQEVIRLDEEWGLGGFILFKRNLQEIDQIFDLNESLQHLGRGVPFISADQEGGRVTRLPEPLDLSDRAEYIIPTACAWWTASLLM